jgi:hypothetical protein
MEIHDLVPGLKPVRSELGDFSLDVFDRKTDVVHPNFVQVANVRIGQRLGLPIAQELDFRSWGRVLRYERDVVGLDTWNAHVTGKWLSSNHDGHGFLEAQESKKPLGAVNIPHDDRAVVEMFYHASTPPCVPSAIIASAESLSIRADWIRHGVSRDHLDGVHTCCKRAKRLVSFNLAIPSKTEILLVSDAEPMRKSLIIAIIASLVSTLVNAKPYTQRRTKAQPRSQIACTVVGCSPVPAGCVPRPGRTWSGLPSGFDVIVCPPGGRPVR